MQADLGGDQRDSLCGIGGQRARDTYLRYRGRSVRRGRADLACGFEQARQSDADVQAARCIPDPRRKGRSEYFPVLLHRVEQRVRSRASLARGLPNARIRYERERVAVAGRVRVKGRHAADAAADAHLVRLRVEHALQARIHEFRMRRRHVVDDVQIGVHSALPAAPEAETRRARSIRKNHRIAHNALPQAEPSGKFRRVECDHPRVFLARRWVSSVGERNLRLRGEYVALGQLITKLQRTLRICAPRLTRLTVPDQQSGEPEVRSRMIGVSRQRISESCFGGTDVPPSRRVAAGVVREPCRQRLASTLLLARPRRLAAITQ